MPAHPIPLTPEQRALLEAAKQSGYLIRPGWSRRLAVAWSSWCAATGRTRLELAVTGRGIVARVGPRPDWAYLTDQQVARARALLNGGLPPARRRAAAGGASFLLAPVRLAPPTSAFRRGRLWPLPPSLRADLEALGKQLVAVLGSEEGRDG